MQNIKIAPSILSADLLNLEQDLAKVVQAGADWIHFDVMDNHFVPNLSFGPDLCSAISKYNDKLFLDVHLMISPVDNMIESFVKAGASSITFHPSVTNDVDAAIKKIKDSGCLVGLAFNPNEPIDCVKEITQQIDMILIMSVYPGFGGQKFIPDVLDKVQEARQLIDSSSHNIRLQIDGGINQDNIKQVLHAGADTIVAGSAIFKYPNKDYSKIIKILAGK